METIDYLRSSTTHPVYPYKSNGFSLLEILFVMSLMAVIMHMALPNWQAQQASIQTDMAWLFLQQILLAQMEYVSLHKAYSSSLADLGMKNSANDVYIYSIELTSNSFVAVAELSPRYDFQCWRLSLDANGVNLAHNSQGELIEGCY